MPGLMRPFEIRISGQTWRVVCKRLRRPDPHKRGGYYGECDHKRHVIYLDERQSPGEFIDTAYHEAMHACGENLKEEAVGMTCQAGRDIVQGLANGGMLEDCHE
jgi:hypothetical protein